MPNCVICGRTALVPVYRSGDVPSVTSNSTLYDGVTEVAFCPNCAHLQTHEIEDIDHYYDTEYNILADTEEEDQIYSIGPDRTVYRNEHQIETLLGMLDLPRDARVLDYGCAKGAVLREAVKRRPDLRPFLFDVSENYMRFWPSVAPPENCATYALNPAWNGTLDAVVSFFVLEHVPRPVEVLRTIHGLLKPGGTVYFIVPNVYANPSDLICVDHANHFSGASLRALLGAAGFEPMEITDRAHAAAWVTLGRRSEPAAILPSEAESAELQGHVSKMGRFWEAVPDRVREFEIAHPEGPLDIYGSGVNGCMIAACLRNRDRVDSFVDRNPYRQGKRLLGRPIIPPEKLARDHRLILVGLNPLTARAAIGDLLCWRDRDHDYFFL